LFSNSNHPLTAQGRDMPFFTRERGSIMCEQSIIYRQLFAGHVVGSRPIKRKEKSIEWWKIMGINRTEGGVAATEHFPWCQTSLVPRHSLLFRRPAQSLQRVLTLLRRKHLKTSVFFHYRVAKLSCSYYLYHKVKRSLSIQAPPPSGGGGGPQKKKGGGFSVYPFGGKKTTPEPF